MTLQPAPSAGAVALADILHEVRRALARPVFHIHRGGIAQAQGAALAFGLLAPDATEPRLLIPTGSGKAALAASDRETARARLPIHRIRRHG